MTLRADILTDLDTILSTDDFAVVATLSGGSTINVIFDNPYFDVLAVESRDPSAVCKTSDVTALVHGSTLVIDSITYYITEKEPTGYGTTLLRLSKEA